MQAREARGGYKGGEGKKVSHEMKTISKSEQCINGKGKGEGSVFFFRGDTIGKRQE